MLLRLLARDMKRVAESCPLPARGGRVSPRCLRQFEVDDFDLEFVLTLRAAPAGGRPCRRWELSFYERAGRAITDRLVHRVLHAFFGHNENATEPDPSLYTDASHDDRVRTFFAAA